MKSHQRELVSGLIRLHVLIHAAHEAIFGVAVMEELEHHGYQIGPGTLYPLLHGMEKRGWLKSDFQSVSGRNRRVYKITASGRKALEHARLKVDELHHKMHQEHSRKVSDLGKP